MLLIIIFPEMCPTCTAFYGNRAATYMMLSRYDKALEDARKSILLEPTFVKVSTCIKFSD